MPLSEPSEERLHERLTRQFYEWEMWGRGWQIWEQPVHLEPPFRPFLGHFDSGASGTLRDDARKPTLFSSLFERAVRKSHGNPVRQLEEWKPEPRYDDSRPPLVEMQVALPPEVKIGKESAEKFLLTLGHVSHPISFEIVGTAEQVIVQIACTRPDSRHVREQLQAYFPEAVLTEVPGFLLSTWDTDGGRSSAIVDFGLSKEFMRPLRSYDRFDPDPLASLIAASSELSSDELSVVQILFAPVRSPWSDSIMRAATDWEGNSFFADDPAMATLAATKVATPLFAVVIRVASQSARQEAAWNNVLRISKSLRQFIDSTSNELIPLSNDGYEDEQHVADVLLRQTCRSGMLLNCDELVSLVHLPSASVRTAKLKRENEKTKAPPALARGHELVLGECHHAGKTYPVTLSQEQRVRHLYTVGASGTGKSTLLLNMITQDMQHGNGIAVLDPHGDLIDQVLSRVPEDRINDVVLLDPSDEGYPVGFNILSAHSDLERNLLSSDLVSVFRRLSTSFGDQMNTVLGNAIMAFLESTDGGTLLDLRRFLVETEYRQRVLTTVQDREIVYYWQREFPLLVGKPQGPILTRLDTFLRPKVIRYMVAQQKDRLNFAHIMNGKKIFLAKLSQGLIGEENSFLLGTLLVSKFNQIAMSRQSVTASQRNPFYLYIDEFHNFVTPSLAAILSGARKYQLGLVLAHQELHQLASRDSDVANAVISNPYTRVCFRLGDFDAKKLQDGFSFFGAKDLQNLGVGQAICRMERAEYDFNISIPKLSAIAEASAPDLRQKIIASSREQYATPREEVEAVLNSAHSEFGNNSETDRATRTGKRAAPARTTSSDVLPPASHQAEVTTPGRGGEHHKYLQQLIKRWAEARGFTVTIEKPILDGLGSVDVALNTDTQTIACEISVTTGIDHELGNVQKCLAAGFQYVVVVSSEKQTLTAIKHAILGALTASQYKQVRFLTPEQVFSFIEGLEAKMPPSAASPDSNEIMTAKEVEELLRIDVKTIYSYAQRGLLPYVRIQSNLRFIRSDILKWMAEKQFKPGTRSHK